MKVLITGGAGFVGVHLVRYLQKKGVRAVVFDQLEKSEILELQKDLIYFQGDIVNREEISKVFSAHGPFSTVYHLASAMPNKAVSDSVLWQTNTYGTANLLAEAVKNKVNAFVFTSSNVAYGVAEILPVTEKTIPHPLEIYGRSKLEAEKILMKFSKDINIQIFRCPVITGTGRLGLQAILYEFISESKNIYVLGDGSNKYQFIDVMDVCSALEKASRKKGFEIYNIGADEVLTLKQLYEEVIKFAQSKSKIISLPKAPALFILSLLDKLNISPLGVYQYTMIGRSMYADTTKIKNKLAWQPEKTNLDTFIENYKWYIKNKGKFVEIGSSKFSSNRSLPKMGVFKLLKMLS